MGKPIVYCGQCGKSLSEDEFTRGRAQVLDHQPFCTDCRPITAPAPPPSTRRVPAKKSTVRRTTSDSPNPRALLIGVAVLIAAILVVVAVVMSGGRERPAEPVPAALPPPKAPSPPMAPPAPPPSAVTPRPNIEREMEAERDKARAAQFDSFLAQIREIVEKGWRLELRRAEIEGMLASAQKIAGKREAEVRKLREEFERRASLIAHWKLDEAEGAKAEDATGNDHDGELSNGPQRTPGKIGGALVFNGTDSGVIVRQSAGLSPHVQGGEMTLAAWVNVSRLPSKDGQGRTPIVAKGELNAYEYALYVHAAGHFSFATWNLQGIDHLSTGGGRVVPGQWQHVVGVYEKGKSARLYVDGKEVNRGSNFANAIQAGPSAVFIGRRGDGQFLAGAVDDVRIYRRALSDDDIKALFEGK